MEGGARGLASYALFILIVPVALLVAAVAILEYAIHRGFGVPHWMDD